MPQAHPVTMMMTQPPPHTQPHVPAPPAAVFVNAPMPPITGQRRAYIEIDSAPLSPEIID
jgi:hypothetical protein